MESDVERVVENEVVRVVRWRMRWRVIRRVRRSDVERVMWRGVLQGIDS